MAFSVNGVRNLIETELRSIGRTIYRGTLGNTANIHGFPDPQKEVVLKSPEHDREGYWVGAASPFYDTEEEELYLYYRLRDPYSRGRKTIIARYHDEELKPVNEFYREDFNAYSLEGGSIRREDNQYVLYLSYQEKSTEKWKIDRIKADSIDDLSAEKREALALPIDYYHVKDPIFIDGELVVHTASRYFNKLSNFTVKNPANNPEVEEVKFHEENSSDRVTSMLEIDEEKYYFYDWRESILFTGEEKTKIGVEKQGEIEDFLAEKKAIGTYTGTHSLRYVRSVDMEDETWFFYERSMPGKGHELCYTKMKTSEMKEKFEEISS